MITDISITDMLITKKMITENFDNRECMDKDSVIISLVMNGGCRNMTPKYL